jgi:hypothetical protein
MLGYLEAHPTDAQALNDAGTLLFCLQRGAEAIRYMEKALCYASDEQRKQISWNLCEAYITESCPEKAMGLFQKMRTWGILNADTINRTADVFLKQNHLGLAIAALSLSMRLWPDQQVLEPMMQVLRSKRGTLAIFSDRDRLLCRMLTRSMNQWMPTECFVGLNAEQIQQQMQTAGVSVFIGCGESAIIGLKAKTASKRIVIVDEQDIYGPMIGMVAQTSVDAVVACAGPQAIEELTERTGYSPVIRAEPVPQVETMPLVEKKGGLRIAAVGPWTLRQNPMFLLQCFQKFNYIHPDSRLYLAGEFEDAGLQRYMLHLVEALDLENRVFFDSPVKSWEKWFRDKQVVVSTAVDASGMAVHRFAGVETLLDERFIFDISEEFCCQAESQDGDPVDFRQKVQDQFEQASLALKLHAKICEFETAADRASAVTPPVSIPASMDFPTSSVASPQGVLYQSLCSEIESVVNHIGTFETIN